MFFAITAASLPVLNSLLPKSWGSHSNSDLTPITPSNNSSGSLHKHDGAGLVSESKFTTQESIIKVEDMTIYDNGILNDVEKGQNGGSLSPLKGA